MTTTLAPPVGDLAFRVEARPFAAACAWVAKRLPAKPSVPVLAGVLLEVADGQLTLSGFDYETAVRAVVGDVVAECDGRALVSGRLLAALAATFPDKPVQVGTDGNRVTVRCGALRLTLPAMPVHEHPVLPDPPPVVGTIDADAFVAAVERVAVAADKDCSAGIPALSGVNLAFGAGHVDVMATDRYRGAIARIPWQPAVADFDDMSTIVPVTVMVDAARTFDGVGGQVQVALRGGLIGLAAPGHSVIARVIDGQYVALAKLVPSVSDNPARIPVAELATALRRADLVRQPKTPARLEFSGNQVTVSAKGDEAGGDIGEPVDCDYAGPGITLGANPAYLLDALGALRSPTALLSMTTVRRPLLITAPDDPDYRHMISPMQTN